MHEGGGAMAFLDDQSDLRETQQLEFKEAGSSLPKDIWETYSAFANTEGGKIVLGVRELEDHSFEIVGVKDPLALLSQFWTSVHNRQLVERDVMLPDGARRENAGGVDLVIVDVPRAERGDKPVRVYDRRSKQFVAYVRRGESDLEATEADIRLMAYDGVPGADRRPLEEFGVDALCAETVTRYRNIFSSVKPLSPWNADSTEDFLFHIGAMAKGRDGGFHPTQAGLLAFGYEYQITGYAPHFLLDYREETSEALRWDDRIVSHSGDWSGNLVDFYSMVSSRLSRLMRAPFSTDEDGRRHSSATRVLEAVNEAVVNALVHAYYGSTGGISVIVGSESICVRNPGSLLVDREVAIVGGTSETRNPTLMKIFALIGASDRAGSGLCDIWSTWDEEFGIEPRLEESHAPSSVTLSLPISSSRPPAPAPPAGRVSGERALVVLGARDGLTPREFAALLPISERVAQKRLKELYESGEVSRVRDGRSWRYFLNKQ